MTTLPLLIYMPELCVVSYTTGGRYLLDANLAYFVDAVILGIIG